MLLFALIAVALCDNWAILVAGSNTYSNYRHQSDVCQSFQQLKQAGIAEDHIIVWMYDDIANSPSNPHKGSIINYQGGPNVYPGVPHDYTGKDVIPTNFLDLLRGKDMTIGSKKSLKSTSEDNVFIYFTDHGGPGIICFPGFIELHVKDLISALHYMNDNNMYKNLVFYLEACESGSMFAGQDLPENLYAVTASDPHQSSYACDYNSDYRAYLNDCWSRNYMNDTRWAIDNDKMNVRTYLEQFDWVKTQTTQSPECAYGDLDIQKMTLDAFQGGAGSKYRWPEMTASSDRVPTHDVKLRTMERNIEAENDGLKRSQMQIELEDYKLHRYRTDLIWGAFSKKLDLPPMATPVNSCNGMPVKADCMKPMVEAAKDACGNFDEYSSKYYKTLNHACLSGVTPEEAFEALNEICFLI